MKNLEYKNYYGSVDFDREENIFYGKLEFICALVSYESGDEQGIEKAFKEAVEDYLTMCREQKIEPEIPVSKGSAYL